MARFETRVKDLAKVSGTRHNEGMATRGRPAPDPAVTARAAQLAASGTPRAQIAVELGVGERTVSRWLGRPAGRPRLAEGTGSRTTAWRRRRQHLPPVIAGE
jgi:hypothetical protein